MWCFSVGFFQNCSCEIFLFSFLLVFSLTHDLLWQCFWFTAVATHRPLQINSIHLHLYAAFNNRHCSSSFKEILMEIWIPNGEVRGEKCEGKSPGDDTRKKPDNRDENHSRVKLVRGCAVQCGRRSLPVHSFHAFSRSLFSNWELNIPYVWLNLFT